VLVIRGREVVISTPEWGQRLAALAGEGRYVEVPGPHTFGWRYPGAWSAPIRSFARHLADATTTTPAQEGAQQTYG
jgi:hypothetical protein